MKQPVGQGPLDRGPQADVIALGCRQTYAQTAMTVTML